MRERTSHLGKRVGSRERERFNTNARGRVNSCRKHIKTRSDLSFKHSRELLGGKCSRIVATIRSLSTQSIPLTHRSDHLSMQARCGAKDEIRKSSSFEFSACIVQGFATAISAWHRHASVVQHMLPKVVPQLDDDVCKACLPLFTQLQHCWQQQPDLVQYAVQQSCCFH